MATAEDYGFEPYGGFKPTSFDHHICIDHLLDDDEDSREHWAKMPVSRTRDSDVLTNCNFQEFLEGLGGESETVEVHRFGHWGPGWFEIILVNPDDETAMKAAYDMTASLQDYPVLNEEKLSEMEREDAQESWDNWAERDVRKRLESLLESFCNENEIEYSNDFDFEDLASDLISKHIDKCGLPEYETGSDGAHFDVDRIAEDIFDTYEEENFE